MAPPGRKTRQVLPLLEVLRKMKPAHRVIVLAHLNDATRDDIYATVAKVLTSRSISESEKVRLRRKLGPHKQLLRYLADGNKRKNKRKKKDVLMQVGAGPMGHVLSAAVPMMLDLFS